jgi:hypothetical protein
MKRLAVTGVGAAEAPAGAKPSSRNTGFLDASSEVVALTELGGAQIEDFAPPVTLRAGPLRAPSWKLVDGSISLHPRSRSNDTTEFTPQMVRPDRSDGRQTRDRIASSTLLAGAGVSPNKPSGIIWKRYS